MIKNFHCRETSKIFNRQFVKKLPNQLHSLAYRKLLMLHVASLIQDLRMPLANRLEKLKGNRVGQHSIRINKQWRICFRWHKQDAYDVEIIDYHEEKL